MSEPINDVPNSNESIPDLNTNQSVEPNPFITNATEVEPVIEEPPVIEQPVIEEPVVNEQPVIEEPVVNEQPFVNEPPVVNEQPVVNEPVVEEPNINQEKQSNSTEEITLTIDKSTLVSLCQNLNTNLLVNIAAYKSVLTKLRDSEKDNIKISALDTNITTLNELESSVSALLNTVQTSLDVPKNEQVDPQTVIKEASGSKSSANGFMQKLLGAEAAAILGSMTAATVLMLGGAKTKRKNTRRRRNKGNKLTKRHKQK